MFVGLLYLLCHFGWVFLLISGSLYHIWNIYTSTLPKSFCKYYKKMRNIGESVVSDQWLVIVRFSFVWKIGIRSLRIRTGITFIVRVCADALLYFNWITSPIFFSQTKNNLLAECIFCTPFTSAYPANRIRTEYNW